MSSPPSSWWLPASSVTKPDAETPHGEPKPHRVNGQSLDMQAASGTGASELAFGSARWVGTRNRRMGSGPFGEVGGPRLHAGWAGDSR